MELIIDSHVLLWFYNGNEELSEKITTILKNPINICYISIASVWELTIKYSLGKLELENNLEDLFEFIERNEFKILDIEFSHLLKLNSLPFFHRDPFDRVIIAQSIANKLPLATRDTKIMEYELEIIW